VEGIIASIKASKAGRRSRGEGERERGRGKEYYGRIFLSVLMFTLLSKLNSTTFPGPLNNKCHFPLSL
jgi:hypothetical protein